MSYSQQLASVRIEKPMPGESIEGSLKERGVRLTRQRQILLELIDKTGDHLDAERLFQLAKEKDPSSTALRFTAR